MDNTPRSQPQFAAYACSKIDDARDALEQVLEHADSLQTILDAYDLLRSIIFGACVPKDYSRFSATIADLLRSLGEDLPADDDAIRKDLPNQVKVMKESLEGRTDASLLNMSVSGSESAVAIARAYDLLVGLTYAVKPKLCPYIFLIPKWHANIILVNSCVHPRVLLMFKPYNSV
jgi:hypothetical protein